MPLGDGHAIGCAEHLINDEPVLIMFGDTLYDSEISPAEQVVKAYENCQSSVIGLSRVSKNEVSNFGVIDGDLKNELYEIKKFVEKPQSSEAPTNLAAVGIYVITPEIFKNIKRVKKEQSEEIRLADAFSLSLKEGVKIYGQELLGEWLDTGSKIGLIKATIKLGLKNKEVGQALKDFLKNLKNI
jgi:UTP--glucose-1-phosphate uridylyltransferase